MENKIDELFAKKLKGNIITPSDRVKALFEQKLKEKKKRKVFVLFRNVLSVAASLVVLALIGVYFNDTTEQNQIAINKTGETTEPATSTIEIGSEILDNQDTNEDNRDKEFNATKNIKVTKKVGANIAQVIIKQPNKVLDKNNTEDTNLGEKKPILALKTYTNTEEIKNKEIDQTITKKARNEEIIVYVSPIASEPKIAQTKSELRLDTRISEGFFEEDVPERTMVTKVLDEVKGLKRGENVDFNKLGFKSIEELALNEDGFIASEAKQIKQRIYWIKSKLNNTK